MATKNNQIDYYRNTTLSITYTYKKDGVASTDGVTLFFTVKTAQFDSSTSDTTAIVKKSPSFSGGSSVTFTIDPPDIADTVAPGLYYYDFKVKESDGPPKVIYQGVAGRFNLIGEPTNRET